MKKNRTSKQLKYIIQFLLIVFNYSAKTEEQCSSYNLNQCADNNAFCQCEYGCKHQDQWMISYDEIQCFDSDYSWSYDECFQKIEEEESIIPLPQFFYQQDEMLSEETILDEQAIHTQTIISIDESEEEEEEEEEDSLISNSIIQNSDQIYSDSMATSGTYTPQIAAQTMTTSSTYTPKIPAQTKPTSSTYNPQIAAQTMATSSTYTPQIAAETMATSSTYTPQIAAQTMTTSSTYTPQIAAQTMATSSTYTPQIAAQTMATSSTYTPQMEAQTMATSSTFTPQPAADVVSDEVGKQIQVTNDQSAQTQFNSSTKPNAVNQMNSVTEVQADTQDTSQSENQITSNTATALIPQRKVYNSSVTESNNSTATVKQPQTAVIIATHAPNQPKAQNIILEGIKINIKIEKPSKSSIYDNLIRQIMQYTVLIYGFWIM